MKTTVNRRWTAYQIESWLLEKNLIEIRQKTRRIMAYRDFKFSDLEEKLGIKQQRKKLFAQPNSVTPSGWLQETIQIAQDTLVMTTEKAVSEGLVAPILQEIARHNPKKLQLFSGEILMADKSKGLNGECDFVFTKTHGSLQLQKPIIQITEAKKNDMNDLRSLSQTAAQMVGARIFNQKATKPIETIYGACTNGYEWIFLKLEGQTVFVDTDRYNLVNLPQLLGILQTVVDFYD